MYRREQFRKRKNINNNYLFACQENVTNTWLTIPCLLIYNVNPWFVSSVFDLNGIGLQILFLYYSWSVIPSLERVWSCFLFSSQSFRIQFSFFVDWWQRRAREPSPHWHLIHSWRKKRKLQTFPTDISIKLKLTGKARIWTNLLE